METNPLLKVSQFFTTRLIFLTRPGRELFLVSFTGPTNPLLKVSHFFTTIFTERSDLDPEVSWASSPLLKSSFSLLRSSQRGQIRPSLVKYDGMSEPSWLYARADQAPFWWFSKTSRDTSLERFVCQGLGAQQKSNDYFLVLSVWRLHSQQQL